MLELSVLESGGAAIAPVQPGTGGGESGGIAKLLAVYTFNYKGARQSSSYTVTVAGGENGAVAANKETAEAGETVTLTLTPNDGYVLKNLTVKQGETEVTVTRDADDAGKATFTMPAGDVSVTATFKQIEPTYVVTIPAGVSLNEVPAHLTIAVSEVENLPDGHGIFIRYSSANDFALVGDSDSIPYTMSYDNDVLAHNSALCYLTASQMNIELALAESADGKPAGEYSDMLTFTASVEVAPKQAN